LLEEPAHTGRWITGITAVALAFGLGFVPMWLKAERHEGEHEAARREIRLWQLEGVAAAAVVDARRGAYEQARRSVSWFFTALQVEFESGASSSLSLAQRDSLKPLLAYRDPLMTSLARGDTASTKRLTEVYLACRKSLRGG
jgi:hypothetical protein